jgi:hypothetical protein
LIDEETGAPAANRQIAYGIHINIGNKGMGTTAFGGGTKTDANGEYTINGLVLDQSYTFEGLAENGAAHQPNAWRSIDLRRLTRPELFELGDRQLKKPYTPSTTRDEVAKKFADSKLLEERLNTKIRDARFGYQRVLMVIGDPVDALVTDFYNLEYDPELTKYTLNYLFLPVKNTGAENFEADKAYAAKLGIDWPSENDATLAIFDEKGKALAQTSLIDFLTERKLDRSRLGAFLDKHSPVTPDAGQLLSDALAKAKREDKRVLVEVGGPRCGWCTVLSRYLDEHRDLIDKEFVCLRLEDRLKRGIEVTKSVRPKPEGGVPWMVILDADGKPLITSDANGENIGYPGEPEGQVHFEKMLRTGTKHLTDADIKTLIAALAKDNK